MDAEKPFYLVTRLTTCPCISKASVNLTAKVACITPHVHQQSLHQFPHADATTMNWHIKQTMFLLSQLNQIFLFTQSKTFTFSWVSVISSICFVFFNNRTSVPFTRPSFHVAVLMCLFADVGYISGSHRSFKMFFLIVWYWHSFVRVYLCSQGCYDNYFWES